MRLTMLELTLAELALEIQLVVVLHLLLSVLTATTEITHSKFKLFLMPH